MTDKTTAVVFKSTMPFMSFFLKSGKQLAFIGHKCRVTIQEEIDELMHEVNLKHPHISVSDETEEEVKSPEEALEEVKAKAIADYIAKQAAANNLSNDRGESEQGKLNVANSTTVAQAAANGAASPAGSPTK